MRILLVEDEKSVAKFVKKGLEEEYYTVDVATDGESALQLFLAHPYDLVIVDIMLPKLDGFSLTEKIRSVNKLVPLLILTARTSVEDRVKGLDLGADDYFIKPFVFSELSARVRALLRRKAPQGATEIRIGDVLLDPVRHIVSVSGQPLDLTPREFALLEYLMRHAGYVLTRTMISEHVWNLNFSSMTNIVDVYIRYVRKKLEEKGARSLIHTVRGVGYTLRQD